MRVKFNIETPEVREKAWTIVIDGAGKQWRREMLRRDDGNRGLLPFPASGTPATGLAAQEPAAVLKAYAAIVGRTPPISTVEYGRYLFDNLLGEEIWKEILDLAEAANESLIELALFWEPKDGNLSRLHWEMMFDGSQFLAAGRTRREKKGSLDVAVTRVVPGSVGVAHPLSACPRVLFAIGTSLTDSSIRPGAEIMGLLRDPEVEDRISPMVLENASPKLVEERISRFLPEVVHFICHGKVDAKSGAGYIEIKANPSSDQTAFYAEQVWAWLQAGGAPPEIVVLSACESGTGRALGPEAVAPLAAELTAQGVPVVVAMSGRVSDLACRLFTRTFSRALLSGETLVSATAKGRRAAIAEGEAPKRSVDWGFPVIYLSAKVDPEYAPGTQVAASKEGGLQARIKTYQLRRTPVFCGRNEFFFAFRELFSERNIGSVLAAYVAPEPELENVIEGYGRTRLLEELTIQAIRDGNVPCVVLAANGSSKSWSPPKSPLDLALLIDSTMETARASLGLETGKDRPITWLKSFNQGVTEPRDLDPWLLTAVRMGHTGPPPLKVSPYALAKAIEKQFAQLMAEARAQEPKRIAEKGRAVLLLDEVHEYFEHLDSINEHQKLGVWGFGSEADPVPVVISFALGTVASDLLRPIAESRRIGWRALQLRRFDRGPLHAEDMLAYGRVLLNRFNDKLVPDISDREWVMDYGIDPKNIKECESEYRKNLKGVPSEFSLKDFFWVTRIVMMRARELKVDFLMEATDRDELSKLIKEDAKT